MTPKLACGPQIELVGGPYCGVVLDTKTGTQTTVCTTSPIQDSAYPVKFVAVTGNILEAEGARGAFRYRRATSTSNKWHVLPLATATS